jgi:hypothetical protein
LLMNSWLRRTSMNDEWNVYDGWNTWCDGYGWS